MRRSRFMALGVLIALVTVLSTTLWAGANTSLNMDFEGLPEGTLVSSISSGAGISGDVVGGSVSVFATNAKFGPGINTAMIFDGTCGGSITTCSSGTAGQDLFLPDHGNLLISSKDLDSSDPDDVDRHVDFDFDFSAFGEGIVKVVSIDVIDVEDDQGEVGPGAEIKVFSGGLGGTLLGTFPLPDTGNGGVATIAINVSEVDFLRVSLRGSGAIDSIRVEQVTDNPGIDIEKLILTSSGGDNVCDNGKPVALTMLYNGGNTISNTQGGKAKFIVNNLGNESPVRIIANDKNKPFDSKAKVWFDDQVVSGATFEIDATVLGENKLKSNTGVHIFDLNDNLLQSMVFHTSCSQLLSLGDQFGGVQLVGFLDENGNSGTLASSTSLGEDADTPTGPVVAVGETVVFNYVVTNTGDVALENVVVTDDNGTPSDTSDDFNPTFVGGDVGGDNVLGLTEVWLYTASRVVTAGQYTNLGTVTGDSPSQTVTDDDPNNHFGLESVCADGGKPQVLTMLYNGGNTISNTQGGKAKFIVNNLGSESPVRIIANDKDKPFDSKAKVWFDDQVVSGATFEIDATVLGGNKLKANTVVHIFDLNDNLLQSVKFHTSCSQPLNVGDQFGGVQLVGFVLE